MYQLPLTIFFKFKGKLVRGNLFKKIACLTAVRLHKKRSQ